MILLSIVHHNHTVHITDTHPMRTTSQSQSCILVTWHEPANHRAPNTSYWDVRWTTIPPEIDTIVPEPHPPTNHRAVKLSRDRASTNEKTVQQPRETKTGHVRRRRGAKWMLCIQLLFLERVGCKAMSKESSLAKKYQLMYKSRAIHF